MVGLLRKTFEEFLADNCFSSAAALAYHAIFAIGPLVVLTITIAGMVMDPERVSGEVERQLSQVISEDGAVQVRLMIRHFQQAPASPTGAILGTLAILLGATGFLTELQAALNTAWNAPPDQGGFSSLLFKRAVQVVAVLAIAAILLASMLVSMGVAFVIRATGGWIGQEISALLVSSLDFCTALLLHALIFAAIFKFLPDVRVAWRDAVTGGAFTAFCFMVGRWAIGLYLGAQDISLSYGAAGSLVLVLIWVYYSTLILLLGAEFTQVWSRRNGLAHPARPEPLLTGYDPVQPQK
jgi:membrane protein